MYHKDINFDLRTGQQMPYRLFQNNILGNCVLMNQVPKGQTIAVNFGVRARQLLSFFWKVISGTKISTIVTVKQSMHLAFNRLPYEACVHPILKQNPSYVSQESFQLKYFEIVLENLGKVFFIRMWQTFATNHYTTLQYMMNTKLSKRRF